MKKSLLICMVTLALTVICSTATRGRAQTSDTKAASVQPTPTPVIRPDNTTLVITAQSLLTGSDYCTETIESAQFQDGVLEIVRRSTCIPTLVPAIGCSGGPCDFTIRRIWKEIYTAENGKIVVKIVEGTLVPAQPERVEWPKDSPVKEEKR